MHTEQGNTMLSLRTANDFVEQNKEVLPEVMKSGAKQRLDELISSLDEHASNQQASTIVMRGATQAQRALREALRRDHMAPIARIARMDLPKTPQLDALRMPRGRPNIERLAAAATGMADAAMPYAAVFIAAGRPADFIERLNQMAEALVASVKARSKARGHMKGATQGLRAKLTAGRKIVHVLDAYVQSELKDDPALLADWSVAMRVVKSTRPHSATNGPVPTPTPAPTGSTGAPASPATAAPGAPASVITAA